jgi:hypothetical protein
LERIVTRGLAPNHAAVSDRLLAGQVADCGENGGRQFACARIGLPLPVTVPLQTAPRLAQNLQLAKGPNIELQTRLTAWSFFLSTWHLFENARAHTHVRTHK